MADATAGGDLSDCCLGSFWENIPVSGDGIAIELLWAPTLRWFFNWKTTCNLKMFHLGDTVYG